jgi:hypothetical protein
MLPAPPRGPGGGRANGAGPADMAGRYVARCFMATTSTDRSAAGRPGDGHPAATYGRRIDCADRGRRGGYESGGRGRGNPDPNAASRARRPAH